MTYDDEQQNLVILAEEAGEVVRIACKCMRFGVDDYHPKNGAVNRVALAHEIGHLMRMVSCLTDQGTISAKDVADGIMQKSESLNAWYRVKEASDD
jgi:hypothetical protein